MLLVWLGLAALVVAAVAGTWFAVVRARELLRRLRELGDALSGATATVGAATARLSDRTFETEALERSLDRLAVSRARLSVLLTAFADVRASLTRLRSVVPRK